MKLNLEKWYVAARIGLIISLILPVLQAHALEPEVLFNFQQTPYPITSPLVQAPDGNFYGTTPHGGATFKGQILRVTPAGALAVVASDITNLASGLVLGNDGQLYGMTGLGNGTGFGTVFRLSTSGALTTIAAFNGTNGFNPRSGLVLARDGNFYGVSPGDGTNSVGSLFRVTPGGTVTLLVSFDGASRGGVPVARLTIGSDGNLYGVTLTGGAAANGTIFKSSLAGTLTTLHSFQTEDGDLGFTPLTLGPDGNLYGVLQEGGSASAGELYKITTNGVFTSLVSFTGGANGASPMAELTLGPDKQLYGSTTDGGTSNRGTIFKVTTNGVLTTLLSFTEIATARPEAGLLLANDGNFYGASPGAVFKLTPAGALSVVVSLIPLDGFAPLAGLTLGPDGNFYGITAYGGTNNCGSIFRLTPNGVFTTLASLTLANGFQPRADLVLGKDGNFYGTTTQGGANFNGTVFRFSTNGGGTTTLAPLTAGSRSQGRLVQAADGSLYGTTLLGGAILWGSVYRVTTNGSLSTVFSFGQTNGAYPEDGLIVGKDGNFYGTTLNGGNPGLGTVFRLTPAGALTTLFNFNEDGGSTPSAGLVQASNGVLYGNTQTTGTNNPNAGTIFKITPNGALTELFRFHITDGLQPANKMVFGPDGNLYGTTTQGGIGIDDSFTGFGTVFRITTNGVFTPLVLFRGTNGLNPEASVAFGPDGNLYGTTFDGGAYGGGTIFRIVLAPPQPQLAGVRKMPNGSRLITGTGPAAGAFRLWATTNVSRPFSTWTLLTNSVFASDGTFSFTDSAAANMPARFYRVSMP